MKKEHVEVVKKHSSRFFFIVAAVLFIASLSSLPWAISGIVEEVITPPTTSSYDMSDQETVGPHPYADLELRVTKLDDVGRQALISIFGYYKCGEECGKFTETLVFYSVDEFDSELDNIPPSRTLKLPEKDGSVDFKMDFPVQGNVLFYPFDQYKLGIGVILKREMPDGTVEIFSQEEIKGRLYLTFQEEVTRLTSTSVQDVPPEKVKPIDAPFDYAFVTEVIFERPPYLIVFVMLVLTLLSCVTIYTMIKRPFDQLIINVGGLLIGIWSVRNLMLGAGFTLDVTLADMVLVANVVFILMALIFRGMNEFHRASHLHILPWAKPEEKKSDEKRKCPDCLSEVAAAAKRCAFCTSTLEPEIE